MCDILIATPEATEKDVMLFAKNSDRDPNEAQILEFVPRQDHEENKVELTYVEFPQVRETNAVILSKPWWMWGGEMGVNEHDLVIGNTAVFTKEECKETGLLGMDMVRLALERKETAEEAMSYITMLLEKYGQGGNGSYEHDFYYHNSFLIADPDEAWVLETAGKKWVSKKITGVYSISNVLTIKDSWSNLSDNIFSKTKNGKTTDAEKLDFSKEFKSKPLTGDFFKTKFSKGKERHEYTLEKLEGEKGNITLENMLELLRSHWKEPYKPEKGSNSDICMHYGGFIRQSQTASSQISKIGDNKSVHLFTGTSNPCLSIFKPIYFDDGLPDLGSEPTNKFDRSSYWWKFEKFHRRFQTNYQKFIENFAEQRDNLQNQIIEKINKTSGDKSKITRQSFEKEEELRKEWNNKINSGSLPLFYGLNLKRTNEKAGLNLGIDLSLAKSIGI